MDSTLNNVRAICDHNSITCCDGNLCNSGDGTGYIFNGGQLRIFQGDCSMC